MIVCLFGFFFMFSVFRLTQGDVTITVERLQIFTYDW